MVLLTIDMQITCLRNSMTGHHLMSLSAACLSKLWTDCLPTGRSDYIWFAADSVEVSFLHTITVADITHFYKVLLSPSVSYPSRWIVCQQEMLDVQAPRRHKLSVQVHGTRSKWNVSVSNVTDKGPLFAKNRYYACLQYTAWVSRLQLVILRCLCSRRDWWCWWYL